MMIQLRAEGHWNAQNGGTFHSIQNEKMSLPMSSLFLTFGVCSLGGLPYQKFTVSTTKGESHLCICYFCPTFLKVGGENALFLSRKNGHGVCPIVIKRTHVDIINFRLDHSRASRPCANKKWTRSCSSSFPVSSSIRPICSLAYRRTAPKKICQACPAHALDKKHYNRKESWAYEACVLLRTQMCVHNTHA